MLIYKYTNVHRCAWLKDIDAHVTCDLQNCSLVITRCLVEIVSIGLVVSGSIGVSVRPVGPNDLRGASESQGTGVGGSGISFASRVK